MKAENILKYEGSMYHGTKCRVTKTFTVVVFASKKYILRNINPPNIENASLVLLRVGFRMPFLEFKGAVYHLRIRLHDLNVGAKVLNWEVIDLLH